MDKPKLDDLKKPLRLSIDNLTDHMWGGTWIRSFKNLPPSNTLVGESWELSARPERPSRVEWAPGFFVSLPDLIREHASLLLGEKIVRAHGARLPLLTKFIDAADDLSVQVHPDDGHAPNESGKSEAWFILDVVPGNGNGFVYVGFKTDLVEAASSPEVFKNSFIAALNQANALGPTNDPAVRTRAEELVLPFLNRIAVKPGDVIEVRPGTVHAIGRGVRLFEIQQASDTTYRVWDWNRPDAKEASRGRTVFRPLHLKDAARVMTVDPHCGAVHEKGPAHGAEQELIREFKDRFRLTQINLDTPGLIHRVCPGGVFQALSVVAGKVDIGGVVTEVGRTVLVPAALPEVTLTALQAPAQVLRSTVPA